MASDVNETLATRETVYGDFRRVAETSQKLKGVLYGCGAAKMDGAQREALDMICSKLARIVNGDANYADSWHDVAGYAQLVERTLAITGPEPSDTNMMGTPRNEN